MIEDDDNSDTTSDGDSDNTTSSEAYQVYDSFKDAKWDDEFVQEKESEDDSSNHRVQSDRSATEKPRPNSRDLWAISTIQSYRDNIWTPVANYEEKEAMIKEFRRRYRFIKAKTKRF